jgi:hypothetical protein
VNADILRSAAGSRKRRAGYGGIDVKTHKAPIISRSAHAAAALPGRPRSCYRESEDLGLADNEGNRNVRFLVLQF